MKIFVNGEERDLPNGSTLQDLISAMDLAGRRVAVEVNLDIVPRSAHAAHPLAEGDRVEIVHAIGGG